MNRIYGIIWGQCTLGRQSVLKVNEDHPTKSNIFDSLRIMREKKKITAGLDIKLKKFVRLYHVIRGFIPMRQGKTDPKDTFKLRFDNIYENMKLAGGDNIL